MTTYYLTFPYLTLPYAEVATFLLSNSDNKATLKLGLNESSNTTNLIIPATNDDDKVILKGKSSIVRYFSRKYAGKVVYEKNQLVDAFDIDRVMDYCRENYHAVGELKDLNTIVDQTTKNQSKLNASKKISLSSIILWDFLKTHPSSIKFVDQLEAAHPELNKAVKRIKLVNDSLPVADFFKRRIVPQLITLLKQEFKVDKSFQELLKAIEVPRITNLADLGLTVPRLQLPGNPVQIGKLIAGKFKTDDLIVSVSSQGPFVNFKINQEIRKEKVLSQVLALETEYGHNSDGFGKTCIVEFSSPNIAKPFHAGHLRSTIIGNFIRNLKGVCGWKTIAINYLGDWGKQYGLLALGFQKYGSREKLEENPIIHLFDVYVKINKDLKDVPEDAKENPIDLEAKAIFKKMEDGDTEGLKLWQEFRQLSIKKYQEIYTRLNISFDIYSGESQYSFSQMRQVMNELRELGLLKPMNGAEVVDLEDRKLGNAVIAKSDGSMLYLSRDIAAAIERSMKYKFDKMFYVVGTAQDHHFKQLFTILEKMGKPFSEKCAHVGFGMIGGMSTRKGNVVFLEDILDHTKEEMHGNMKKSPEKYAQIHDPELCADIVGMSAIIVQDMQARRCKDYDFNWSRMLSFEGDTGPYLQYAHSRLCSMERTTGIIVPADTSKINLSLIVEPQALLLLEIISRYPDVIVNANNSLEPSTIVSYIFELSHGISSAWEVLWVLNQPEDIALARMSVYKAARITLGNAMRILGLRPLERM